ncbi:ACP phosphodiesterase [Photorhabdus tasmaniensis]|uniref:ACP phosphodiesterase n=1 Tax=Photorhabdus tasmaniensis TaxID=1004159 RepID=A0ABX0GIV1_9GAMM|nr:ACP phosphodiesterase [Photorhabdus tasmaniensis]NHB89102.1 ACP phosphodiesterase [Photorhabdus tasmaniensis]
MNFLAHLHLATLAESSLLGNLMADFVRGNPEGQYSADVVAGIRMHRRVAPITLDIIWDHFLSLHWDKLVPGDSLPAFIHSAHSQIEPHLYKTPEKFQEMNEFLWSQNWLIRYADLTFIANVLNGMARRHPRLSALSGSFQDIEHHYSDLEALFWQFYPYMMEKAENKDFYNLPQMKLETAPN